VSLVLFVFTLYLDLTIASVPCFVCLQSVSWAYYCQCPLFCLFSLCILSLLLPVSLDLFVFTLYLEPTIASVPCFVCLHCILSLLFPVFLVFFVFTLYLESTIASVPCFVCLHSVSWVYYCQCPLFCLSSWQTKQGTPAIVGSRYRVKTKKTRDTGNSRLKIQSENKQNKGHWQ
jgi:hypothetical protein